MSTGDMWKYFQTEPGRPEDINVLGVDFGAGELSAAEAVFQYKKLELNPLYLNNAGDKWDYTAYMRLDMPDNEIIGKEVMQREGDVYSSIYTNFKRPPEKASEKYSRKLGSPDNPTYKELMGRTFCSLIKRLFDANEELRRKKRTILFVGRPASSIWEGQAKEYQEILKEGLAEAEEKYGQKIDVIVYSEAEAAMACEYYEGHIEKEETIAIIDGGCSTFDCVIVKDGRVVNEYSRQVGAGMIEKNMLDLFLLGKEAESLSVDERRRLHEEKIPFLDYTEGIHTLRLRKRKEEYFGDDGHNRDKDLVYSVVLGGERIRKFIDDDFMDTAIRKIPVRVERSYLEKDMSGGDKTCDYPGFYQAVEAFVKGAGARCFDKKSGEKVHVDRIILTGGATVMPFIQDIIMDVFGSPGEASKDKKTHPLCLSCGRPVSGSRHFSVARGLAYMGCAQLTMNEELSNIKKEVHEKFALIQPLIYDSIQNSCKDALWKEIYIDQMNKWVEEPDMVTLKSWVEIPYKCPVFDVSEGIREVLAQEGIVDDINSLLNRKFRQLFPNAEQDYDFLVEQGDIAPAFHGNLNSIRISLSNLIGSFQSLKNLLGRLPFLDVRVIDWDTRLRREEKERIRKGIQGNKAKTMGSLSGEIESKTSGVKAQIYEAITENLDKTLESYMEGLAPYFVRRYQDGETA